MPAECAHVSAAGSTTPINEVGERLLDRLHALVRQVYIDMPLYTASHGPAAQIIETENGIGMAVRQQHSINAAQVVARKEAQR